MEILDQLPIILTKDSEFLSRLADMGGLFHPGRTVLLPDDAVLIRAPDPKEIPDAPKPAAG